MKNLAFIYHGKLSNRVAIEEKVNAAFNGVANVHAFTTQHQGQSTEMALQAVQSGCTHVICVGGDGSLNETANGLMQAKAALSTEAAPQLRLGVLPYGTGNDFVKTMGITRSIESLREAVLHDKYRPVDLGLVHYFDKEGKARQRYFINITDVGMGGVVAEKLSTYSKWMGAYLTYQRAIVSTLLSYNNQPVEVSADGFTYKGSIMNFIMANGKYFGSGLGIAPGANPSDGKISVVILGEISILDYIKNLGQVQKCLPIQHPQVEYKTATQLSITSPAGPLAIDMDGEFIGYSPMQVQVVPSAVNFLIP